jgi:hypothetical protein
MDLYPRGSICGRDHDKTVGLYPTSISSGGCSTFVSNQKDTTREISSPTNAASPQRANNNSPQNWQTMRFNTTTTLSRAAAAAAAVKNKTFVPCS